MRRGCALFTIGLIILIPSGACALALTPFALNDLMTEFSRLFWVAALLTVMGVVLMVVGWTLSRGAHR